MPHQQKERKETHKIISTDAEKSFEKSLKHFFIIKTFNKLGIEGTYLNIIKAICENP